MGAEGDISLQLFLCLLKVSDLFVPGFVGYCILVISGMRSRPPGTKSGTIEETEDWDDVVYGTSKLTANYG